MSGEPPVSRHLSPRQISGLRKVGDTLLPGEGQLPSFSASRCESAIDRILDFMPPQDLGDLKTLLAAFGFLPRFLVALLMRLLEASPSVPAPVGPLLRLIRLGLRGLVMSLYYADPDVLAVLGYKVGVFLDDKR